MKKDMFRKGWVVSVIILLIGISIAPVVNASFNRISPITKNNVEFDEEDFVEVTCQVNTLKDIQQVIKKIPKTKFDKIKELANKVNALIDEKGSFSRFREAVYALEVELKKVELIPRHIDVFEVFYLLVKNPFKVGWFDTLEHELQVENERGDHLENRFCFVFGTSNNKTGSMLWRMDYWLLLPYFLLKELVHALFGVGNPYMVGPIAKLFIYRPKIIIPIGSWFTYSFNATLVTLGISGVQKIKDEGAYGLYNIDTIGFLGVALGSGSGGFIAGLCLYTDMYFNPAPE